MKTARVVTVIFGLLGLLALPLQVTGNHSNAWGNEEQYVLEFVPTQNAPGAQGTMTIKVDVDKPATNVHFVVSGAYPNTLYTIWTVYNILDEAKWKEAIEAGKIEVPSISASTRPGFPPEGNGVSPLARLDSAFTSGMGQDPGASFVTNADGDGEVQVKLDYDLVTAAPVSNKDIIAQCAPSVSICEKQIKVTTTWLRRFIGEFPPADRASTCANYNATADPDSPQYDTVASKGMNARVWQCVDPATVNPGTGEGLPRVHRFQFDHFRLANHPDDLTHGFIGGNGVDHWIDMVGRRADLVQTGSSVSSTNKK